jgi:hypothetical protein
MANESVRHHSNATFIARGCPHPRQTQLQKTFFLRPRGEDGRTRENGLGLAVVTRKAIPQTRHTTSEK